MTTAVTKFSRQRESIKEYLMNTKEHPTADAIYAKVRETFPNISLGTVYRNLHFLVEHGEIIKLSCMDGSDHFDADLSPHHHFVCKCCSRILDLDMEPIEHINTLANAHFKGRIEGNVTYFYGICEECSLAAEHDTPNGQE
ncbi:MAG: transcriptional repressor [Lachnospiraceae bacterium]|nr:transcriptional repressor [Lachnospiraceae bacterium]